MKKDLERAALIAPAVLLATIVVAATPDAQDPEDFVGQAEEASPGAAVVNGFTITEKDIEERFIAIVLEQTRGRSLPPEQLAELRKSFRPQILEELIDDRLLDEDATKAGVTMTDEERRAILERSLDGQLMRNDYSREEFSALLQESEQITIDDLLARQAEDPGVRQALLHIKLIETRYPQEVAITDEAIKERYETDLEQVYTKPEMVHARHILIGTEKLSEDEARARAQEVLALCREPGADFAALAKEHSTGPSSVKGGDLGFFTREQMVEPFATAAFAMKVGEISDLVQTEFGFHIILVTERREPHVITLDECSPSIRDELRLESIGPLREKHVAMLRESAKIVYPETEQKG